jgi:hypothetical protein
LSLLSIPKAYAVHDTIPRQNAFVPPSLEDARRPPVLLKYTRDKSWSAFKRGASHWSIYEKDGEYRIAGYRTHQKGYWERDPDQTIELPPGTGIDDERTICILQDATRQ